MGTKKRPGRTLKVRRLSVMLEIDSDIELSDLRTASWWDRLVAEAGFAIDVEEAAQSETGVLRVDQASAMAIKRG